VVQLARAERNTEHGEEEELRTGPGFFGREGGLLLAENPAQLILGGRRAEQIGGNG
jgi:hypothetical protein